MAYDQLEPIGGPREDFRLALLRTTVVNIARAIWGGKDTKMANPMQFMPIWDPEEIRQAREPKKQSIEDMKAIIKNIPWLGGKKEKK